MPYTVPNQRVVTIHREKARSDFLGIKNENWQSAARDLGAHALLLYLYLASNADGYDLALSPAAIRQAVGMARSTYHDQFVRLIDKGYLVETGGNTYDFYEVPQTRPGTPLKKAVSADGQNSEGCPSAVTDSESAVHSIPGEDIEINNRYGLEITKEVKIPEVKEIHIKLPTSEPKKTLLPKPEKKEFVF